MLIGFTCFEMLTVPIFSRSLKFFSFFLTIQLSILLENLESKTRMGHRGVKLMTSIKNVAGAFIFQVRLSRYLDVEATVRQRRQREQERVERLRSNDCLGSRSRTTRSLAPRLMNSSGEDFGLQASRERAALYRRAAHALTLRLRPASRSARVISNQSGGVLSA
jgi:hypothetical protein